MNADNKTQEFKDKLEALLKEYPTMRLNVRHEVEVFEVAEPAAPADVVATDEPAKTE